MKKAGRGPGLFLQGPALIPGLWERSPGLIPGLWERSPGLSPGLWHVVRVAPQTVTSLATSAYSSIWSKFMYL